MAPCFVMAEIGMPRAGGDDEAVIGDAPAPRDHQTRVLVDVIDLVHQHGRILLAPQYVSDRHGDLGGRQASSGDLVEQRLKKVVIAAVDDGHVDVRLLQPDRRVEAAESGPLITTRGLRAGRTCPPLMICPATIAPVSSSARNIAQLRRDKRPAG